VELYFIEPWLGIGGGVNAKGMRVFDVAINNKTVLDDLDIWKEAGTNNVYKYIKQVKVAGGKIVISFPEVKSGQAIIAAIAIAKKDGAANKQSQLIYLQAGWIQAINCMLMKIFSSTLCLPIYLAPTGCS
jgi:hypothetical protein